MAKQFDYYDDWQSEPVCCPTCGWTGTFESGKVEFSRDLADGSCPRCDVDSPILVTVRFPTPQESEPAPEQFTEAQWALYLQRKKWWERFERLRLAAPEQLPDIAGDELILTWDLVGDGGEQWTEISCGPQPVWREPAVWEGYARFIEIAQILHQRYGHRIKDLAPTQRSRLFLLGDQIRAIRLVAEARRDLERTPPTFQTDAAKNMYPFWRGDSIKTEERSQSRATRLLLHQTTYELAKCAFLRQMDTMKTGDEIMVILGGFGAGRGWALDPTHAESDARDIMRRSNVIWDSAAERNATEGPWIQKEAESRGLKVNYLWVNADMESRWADLQQGILL